MPLKTILMRSIKVSVLSLILTYGLTGCGAKNDTYASRFDRYIDSRSDAEHGEEKARKALEVDLLQKPDVTFLRSQLLRCDRPERQEAALYALNELVSKDVLAGYVSETLTNSEQNVALSAMARCIGCGQEKLFDLLEQAVETHPKVAVVSGAVALSQGLPIKTRKRLLPALKARLAAGFTGATIESTRLLELRIRRSGILQ